MCRPDSRAYFTAHHITPRCIASHSAAQQLTAQDCAIQNNTIPYSTIVLYSTVQYSTIQYSSLHELTKLKAKNFMIKESSYCVSVRQFSRFVSLMAG
jgi:hypothetical protein